MDQAASSDQALPWNIGEGGQVANLDRRSGLSSGTIIEKLNLDASFYTLLQILSVTLFEKIHLQQALTTNALCEIQYDSSSQLLLIDLTGHY
jgi:hypothetical protein